VKAAGRYLTRRQLPLVARLRSRPRAIGTRSGFGSRGSSISESERRRGNGFAARLRSLLGTSARPRPGSQKKSARRCAGNLEDRIAKSDAAVVDLLLQIERRLDALEQRANTQPIKLRLIGGSDAA
jgi:hypothetical protein